MRVKLSVARFISRACLPTLCCIIAAYFGYHAVWGSGGYYARKQAEVKLARQDAVLNTLHAKHQELQHRIDLLQKNDPDMIQELARTELMDGAPGQVAVPRDAIRK